MAPQGTGASMKLLFLGGADEVGASCTLVEAAGRRVLVDAGIRMQPRDGDQLPHLARLEEAGTLDAVLVTHAHTDHIAALPLVHLARPAVPVFASAPTLSLMRILLGDALRIMDSRWEQEGEIPLYPPQAVAGLLARVRTLGIGQAVPLCDGEWTATFSPAGHILGACSLLLDTPEGRLFFTGDYSLDAQRTVDPMQVPRLHPHVVVTESTYGNRLHAHRRSEERRLVQTVASMVAAGGKVLIPAFALGRAQEAILILLDAQRRGEIPKFPIFVDGMVKSICAAYCAHPEALSRVLRRQVERAGNPFFPEGECAVPVRAPDRQKVLDSPPCAIIASSGMLTGGPSAFYALALAGGADNGILITGYQDEESPGRRLLDLAEGRTRRLVLAGQEVAVGCRVERYSLSAHADSGQMAGVVSRLAPRDVVLVHGDSGARSGLAAALPASTTVHLPGNGEALELGPFEQKRSASRAKASPGVGAGRPFDLALLAEHLRAFERPNRLHTVKELAELWFGGEVGEPEVETLRGQLEASPEGEIRPDPRRPFLYRLASSPEPSALPSPARRKPSGRLEQNQALKVVEELFADCPELYRKGAHVEEGRLTLYFHFPDTVRERFADRLDEVARLTGWSIQVWPQPHQGALVQAALEALPAGLEPRKTPSYFAEDKRIRVVLQAPETLDPEALEQAIATFLQKTGHRLEVEWESQGLAAVGRPLPGVAAGPMEQNQAFARLREALGQAGLAWFRTSLKQDGFDPYIEIALVSPRLAERLVELLADLERELGWPLRVNPEPNHDWIKKRVRELVPAAWGLRKEPGFLKEEALVRLKLANAPGQAEWVQLVQVVEEETGCCLEWTH